MSSALFAAGTVTVIAKAGRDLGLNRLSALLAAAAYGVNPVVVYYAANGMSESCEFFFLAVSLWGLLRYLRDSGPAVRCCRGGAGLPGAVKVRGRPCRHG
jgi:4-amino-4-deoxy-L-arabinose transferase-like glycosyltransferase